MKQKEKQKVIVQDPTAVPKSLEAKTQRNPPPSPPAEDLAVLPIERVTMPTDDVSDLRDVVDAINRLCETMKTSDYDESDDNKDIEVCNDVEIEAKVSSEVELVSPEHIVVSEVETYVAELWSDAASHHVEVVDAEFDSHTVSMLDLDSYLIKNENNVPIDLNPSTGVEHVDPVPSKYSLSYEGNTDSVVVDSFLTQVENVHIVATNQSIRRIEPVVSVAGDPVVYDPEPITTSFEPISEMYYTASSEVSLLSDVELPDRIQEEASEGRETLTRDDRNGVMAGHVAAMRERFESMTRANTPCPDVMRSVSPSLDVYRNITPSPDHLG